jgi:hypothetical protein
MLKIGVFNNDVNINEEIFRIEKILKKSAAIISSTNTKKAISHQLFKLVLRFK